MPNYPSCLRLEPVLEITQVVDGPPPNDCVLVQNLDVYPTRITIYFGFIIQFLFFQSLWTIEIALRMVLFWSPAGEESVTSSPSPEPIPVQPLFTWNSPTLPHTPLPASPNTSSYHEADEGTTRA